MRIYFWKRLIIYQKLGLSIKKIKICKGRNSADFVVFLWNFARAFFLEMPTKSVKNIFFELVDLRKQNRIKEKIHTQVFRHYYVQYMRKISGKNSKPYFRWSSWKSLFYKQKTLFFAKTRSLSKITHFCTKIKYSNYSQNFIKLYKCSYNLTVCFLINDVNNSGRCSNVMLP